MRVLRRSLAVASLALAALFVAEGGNAASFTYQGRLDEDGAPKAGTVDLRFDAFTLDSGGAPLNATPVIRDGVPLTEGVFTVEVDFGANVFTGAPVFVQVGVREDVAGNASTLTGFTDLAPRQAVTATPYAQSSTAAAFASSVANDSIGSAQILNASVGSADIDTSMQRRVDQACAAGQGIRSIGADGSVSCETGLQGAPGATGAEGPPGAAGATGLQGAPGTTGAEGPQGVQGLQGAPGSADAWGRLGNAGTDPATNFIGTTDAQPIELRGNGQRVARLESIPITIGHTANVLLGSPENLIDGGVRGATIGGGGVLGGNSDIDFTNEGPNRVSDHYGTVGGGFNNRAGDAVGTLVDRAFATVGGGRGNAASGSLSTVGGGTANQAFGTLSTVGGGQFNTATGLNSTVGGGQFNTAFGLNGSAGGGVGNSAFGTDSTVGGGAGNSAFGTNSTVGGGNDNCAGGETSWAGGRSAKVRLPLGTGTNTSGSGCDSVENTTDANGDEGTFVWADSLSRDYVSSGPNQFLIRALGGVGIQPGSGVAGDPAEFANVPEAPLHVFKGSAGAVAAAAVDTVAVFENNGAAFVRIFSPDASERGVLFGDPVGGAADGGIVYNADNSLDLRTNNGLTRLKIEGDGDVGIGTGAAVVGSRLHVTDSSLGILPNDHVVLLENAQFGFGTSVLALKIVNAIPDNTHNFVTFFNSSNDPMGAIEANGSGGVTYKTAGADYAEWLPRVDARESIAPGELVGLHAGGRVSKRLDGAMQVLIASTGAAVAGNSPGESAEDTHTLIAFVGQVQARVCGEVRAGDAIVAAENGSGCGVARDSKQLAAHEFARVAGTAWEDAAGDGEHRVRVAVGLGDGGTERAAMLARIDALEATLSTQQALVDALLARQTGAVAAAAE